MKLAIVVITISLLNISYAQSLKWNSLDKGKIYKSTQIIKLQLDESFFELPKGTNFELVEISDLNMIKVHLHKYKISNCPSKRMETDLQLISIEKPNRRKTSVGMNLTKRCIAEVFIDMDEYNTYSFLE